MTHKWWCARLPIWNRDGSIPFIDSLDDFVLFLTIYLEIDKYAKERKEVSLHIQNDELIEW